MSKSISRVLYLTAIYLGTWSPMCSSDLPPGKRRAAAFQALCPYGQLPPCLVLLRVGFTRPVCYHTAGELLPHHFNLTSACAGGRCVSVALSLKSPSPDVIWHPCPMEPGLSSRAEFLRPVRLSDLLITIHIILRIRFTLPMNQRD